ncbi:MAG: ABC transporter substrate-binding protein [Pseudoxanthomonas sp.]
MVFRIGSLLLVVAALVFGNGAATAQEKPTVIRVGAPTLPGHPYLLWGAPGIAQFKGWFDEEFAKDGIHVQFIGFNGGGPMVGQALANGQIDFAGNGDMISLIGKSAGIKSKLILPSGRLENAYLLVRPDSKIHSIQDLRGKKVAYFKGNYIQLQVIRILASQGMNEKDIRNVSMFGAPAINALRNGDVDAVFGNSDSLLAVEKGLAKVVYNTQQGSVRFTAQAGLLVNEDFARRYPQITERFVKVIVNASRWASEEANRDKVFSIWANSGIGNVPTFRRDYAGRPVADRLSPLLDPFFVAQYKDTQNLLIKLGLLRGQPVDIDQWFDRSYLNAALKDLHLENYWVPLDADGRRTH